MMFKDKAVFFDHGLFFFFFLTLDTLAVSLSEPEI